MHLVQGFEGPPPRRGADLVVIVVAPVFGGPLRGDGEAGAEPQEGELVQHVELSFRQGRRGLVPGDHVGHG